MSDDTWTCHVCRDERPDEFISVYTEQSAKNTSISVNVRYCNDKAECAGAAPSVAARWLSSIK